MNFSLKMDSMLLYIIHNLKNNKVKESADFIWDFPFFMKRIELKILIKLCKTLLFVKKNDTIYM